MSEPILRAALYPPLGTTFVLPDYAAALTFEAFLEATPAVGQSRLPEGEFTALLWWRKTGVQASTWSPINFLPVDDSLILLKEHIEYILDDANSDISCSDVGGENSKTHIMRLDLPVQEGDFIEYCLKYRYGEGPWLWQGARVGGRNGKVIVKSTDKVHFKDIISLHAPEDWSVTEVRPGIWSLKSIASSWDAQKLGFPLRVERWMAIVKIAAPWMGPHWSSSSTIDLSEREGVILQYQRRDGKQVCVIPISGLDGMGNRYIVTDKETSNGELLVLPKDDGNEVLEIFVGIGELDIVERVLDSVREVGGIERAAPIEKTDAWRDGLSYCTWNGLGPHLNEDKIFEALRDMDEKNIKIANLIIDDNWQTLDNNQYIASGTWSKFEANSNFKNGLKGLIKRIRAEFPYISNIGVWHALHGYWDGITPGSDIAKSYVTKEYLWKDNVKGIDRHLSLISPSEAERFYDDFYNYLKSQGVDCCKTDVQSRIDELSNGTDKKELMPAYQKALKKASARYLDGKSIYCMSHIPSILFGALIGNHTIRRPVVRTSDDFYPSNPQTHPFHVYANAMNQILFSALDCEPDWDMFQTHDQSSSELHAFARAFSSGSIFMTDAPGTTDPKIVHSMAAAKPNSDALHAILADRPARVVDPYHQFDSEHLFEIETTAQAGAVRIVGICNLTKTPVASFFPVDRLAGSKPSILHSYRHGLLWETKTGIDQANNSKKSIYLQLEPNKFDIFSVLPVYTVDSTDIAVYGLQSKLMGAAAVRSVTVSERIINIEVTHLGHYQIYFSTERKVKGVKVHGYYAVLFEEGKRSVTVKLTDVWWKEVCALFPNGAPLVITIELWDAEAPVKLAAHEPVSIDMVGPALLEAPIYHEPKDPAVGILSGTDEVGGML